MASTYASVRPRYPAEVFEYLARIAPTCGIACDCGAGNGQASVPLGRTFRAVVAVDASEEQLSRALVVDNIIRVVALAEQLPLATGSVDLVLAAQSVHWFDRSAFYAEVRRVLKPQGVIAVGTYWIGHVDPAIDAIVGQFARETLRDHWPNGHAVVHDLYRDLDFDFEERDVPPFSVSVQWNMDELIAFIDTWSGTQALRK